MIILLEAFFFFILICLLLIFLGMIFYAFCLIMDIEPRKTKPVVKLRNMVKKLLVEEE